MVGHVADTDEIGGLFRKLCKEAPAVYRQFLHSDHAFDEVSIGADGAPTTRIDAGLEEICLDILASSGLVGEIVSEEAGLVSIGGSGRFQAILDPLDGTSNAKMGFPYCALSLALCEGGETVAALVLNYDSGDLFTATKGQGARRNGKPVRVAEGNSISEARIVTSRPFSESEARLYGRLMLVSRRVRVVSSPALDMAHVAAGSFMAYLDYHHPKGLIHSHDVIAAKLILEEAGGLMVDEACNPAVLPQSTSETFNVLAINNIRTFDWVRKYLKL